MMSTASLRLKLTLGFGSVLLALAVNSAVGHVSITSLKASGESLRLADDKRRLVLVMRSALEQDRAGAREFLLGNNSLEEIERGQRQFREVSDKMLSLLRTEEEKNRFAQLLQAGDQYGRLLDREVQLRRAGKTKESVALCLSREARDVRQSVNAAFDDFVRHEEDIGKLALDQQRAAEARARLLLTLSTFAGVVVAGAVSVFVPRSLARSVSRMISVIQEIASNNLSADDLRVTSQDELGRACLALNTMKNNLRGLIHSIARTAEHVASASEEISASATQQAHSADTEKSQADQAAVAMQEMSTTVREVSDNSNRAADASRQAAETAREGGTIVEESLAKMRAIADSVSATARKVEELGKSSDQIGRIIGVIDDIADQTNLLALNAAIEAARAGEQGRGFAVVADEVRKLAERTTSATKEVAQMVRSIQAGTETAVAAMHDGMLQVQEGLQTTGRAGDSLKQIIQMSEQVGDMITHIAAAATEQSAATELINQIVAQITRLTAESAVGAQQSAKACQDLSELALDLQKLVGSFHIEASRSASSGFASCGRAQPASRESAASTKAFAAGS